MDKNPNVYEVILDIKIKKWGFRGFDHRQPTFNVEAKDAEQAVRKAKKDSLRKNAWGDGDAVSAKLLSVVKVCTIHIR